MGEVIEKEGDERESRLNIREEKRCVYVFPEGRRCKQRRWRGKEWCFQHDPEAGELRRYAGRPAKGMRMTSAREVHELLVRTLEELRGQRISPGQAYAAGYLAQLVLRNLGAVKEELEEAELNEGGYGGLLKLLEALPESEK
ncbi:MAG: hypothetical protein ACE5HL_12085 [Terriglobia bacterium]